MWVWVCVGAPVRRGKLASHCLHECSVDLWTWAPALYSFVEGEARIRMKEKTGTVEEQPIRLPFPSRGCMSVLQAITYLEN